MLVHSYFRNLPSADLSVLSIPFEIFSFLPQNRNYEVNLRPRRSPIRISQIDIQLTNLSPIEPGAAAPLRHSQDVVWYHQVPREVIRACPL